MIKNTYPGKFIVLEGLDGSGQSTQAAILKDFLFGNGKEVVMCKEPTKDSEAGIKIREILGGKEKINAGELQELFSKDRREHLKNKIIPALQSGKYVISDRYFFSSFAFGCSDGLDLDWLVGLNNDFLSPDLTIVLKVAPSVCIERINKRGTAKELFETEEKLKKVWETYANLPQRFENMFIINGENSIDEVSNNIKERVKNIIL